MGIWFLVLARGFNPLWEHPFFLEGSVMLFSAFTSEGIVAMFVLAGAIVTLIGTVIHNTFETRKAASYARQANDAVNHTHENGQPRILDMVLRLYEDRELNKEFRETFMEWRASYMDSPWKSGVGVREWLETYQEDAQAHHEIHARIEAKLEELFERVTACNYPPEKDACHGSSDPCGHKD